MDSQFTGAAVTIAAIAGKLRVDPIWATRAAEDAAMDHVFAALMPTLSSVEADVLEVRLKVCSGCWKYVMCLLPLSCSVLRFSVSSFPLLPSDLSGQLRSRSQFGAGGK